MSTKLANYLLILRRKIKKIHVSAHNIDTRDINKESMERGTAVTVGTFDGVHTGHRVVLSTLRSLATERGLLPLAVTFDPHPLAVIAPGHEPLLLDTLAGRTARIRAYGVEPVVVPFTEELRRLTAAEWMARLRNDYGTRLLVAGYDNTFGSDCRGMTPSDYKLPGMKLGIEVIVANEKPGVCSSAIRRALEHGDLEDANAMLGYHYEIGGRVVHGRHLGTGLGFPTANVAVSPGRQLPATGVYAALAYIDGDATPHPAVVNIGNNPTVGAGNPVTVEAHLLDYDDSLYGHHLNLKFVERIRGELCFDGLDALRMQIAADCDAARGILGMS